MPGVRVLVPPGGAALFIDRVETRGRKHTRFHKLSPEAMELVKRLLKEMPR